MGALDTLFPWNYRITLLILKRRGNGLIHVIDKAMAVESKVDGVIEYKTRKHGIIPRARTESATASGLVILFEYEPKQFAQIDFTGTIKEAIEKIDEIKDRIDKGKTAEGMAVISGGTRITPMSETSKDFFIRKQKSANKYRKESKYGWAVPMVFLLITIACVVVVGKFWWDPLQAVGAETAKAQKANAEAWRTNLLVFNSTLSEYGLELNVSGERKIVPLRDVVDTVRWR